jgi:hypothetical protein
VNGHTIVMERPKERYYSRPHFQAVCSCGWDSRPYWTSKRPRQVALSHLTRGWNLRLSVAINEAADRGEKIDLKAWYAANPKPALEDI